MEPLFCAQFLVDVHWNVAPHCHCSAISQVLLTRPELHHGKRVEHPCAFLGGPYQARPHCADPCGDIQLQKGQPEGVLGTIQHPSEEVSAGQVVG